ncbi:hypothetical protein BH10BAC5_BH10BAC5_16400 [soil metagenome]
MKLSLQILFYFLIFTVFYSYAGYGMLIIFISRFPRLIKLMPKPYNARSNEFTDIKKDSYPTVSLIISASGESKKTLKEKIRNTKELIYPRNKLEVIFAIAFDEKDSNETIDEYYENFLYEPDNNNIYSKEEELYIRFLEYECVSEFSRESILSGLEKRLSDENFGSDGIRPFSKTAIDNYGTLIDDTEEEMNIYITKDIERKGKTVQINRTVDKAKGEILVFSDSNSFFNKEALINLTRHFSSLQVGCVAGEKRVKRSESSTSGEGEGLYWKYESMLKKADSKVWTTVGAAGEIYAVRRELWNSGSGNKNLSEAIIEDFIISMNISEQGYRVVYEPEAYAEEEPTNEVKDEFIRRKRIAAGGFQSIVWLKKLLNIFKYRTLSFQYISHRVLRWAVVPFILPVILVTNIVLLTIQPDILIVFILLMQAGIYLLSAGGHYLEKKKKKIKIFNIPYMLMMMNVSAYFGLARFLKGSQSAVWEKVSR